MNPTHDKDDNARQHGSAAAALADLLTSPARFRAWIAKAVTTTAKPNPEHGGYGRTEQGQRPLDAVPATGTNGETAGTCQSCDYVHGAGEPCRFGACRRCDLLFGCLSLSQYCPDCKPWPPALPAEDGTTDVLTSAAGGPGRGCQYCGAPGGYPYCQRSVNGNWSCADLAGMDESDLRGGHLDPAERDASAAPVPGSPAEILPLAARYLERHGWIQGAYYDPTATVFTPAADLVGAIGMVCYGGPVEAPAQHFDDPGFLDFEQAVLHLDRYLLVEDGTESYEFNDAKGRRSEDVIRVLRDAAARPAEELIDALRALSAQDEIADRVRLLVPSGAFAEKSSSEQRCPCCASGDRDWLYLVDNGDNEGFCGHGWHDGGSDGGDAR